MSIGDAEYGIVGRTTDGEVGILPIEGITATGQLALPFQTTDGGMALMRVKAADADAQFAFPARLTDGEIGLFAPDIYENPNTCNACDPPLEEMYTVTFSGLTDVFGAWNGEHTLYWHSECSWHSADGSVMLLWQAGAPAWFLYLFVDGWLCYLLWLGGSDECDPTDAYTLQVCHAVSCPGACEWSEQFEAAIGAGPTPPPPEEPGNPCSICTGDTPASWNVTLDGLPEESACHGLLAGDHVVPWVGGCYWTLIFSTDPLSYITVLPSAGAWRVAVRYDATTYWIFEEAYGGGDPCEFAGEVTKLAEYGVACDPHDITCYLSPN